MIILAAALTLGINLEIDLTALFRKQEARTAGNVTCNIKTVGYHFTGAPGQQFTYGGETFTIPREGFVEVISSPRVQTWKTSDGRTLSLADADGQLDAFSFRWITLPASPVIAPPTE